MFIKRNWFWVFAILVVLCIGGFVLLKSNTPLDPVKVYKVVQPEQTQNQTSGAESIPTTVTEAQSTTSTLIPNTRVLTSEDGEPVYRMTRKELDQFIQKHVQERVQPLKAQKEKLEETLAQKKVELAQKKAELAVEQALAETAAWMQEFRPKLKADIAEIQNADITDLSVNEQFTLLEKAFDIEDRINEMWEHIAALPKPARDRILEKVQGYSADPEVANYILAEINSRVKD